MAFAAVVARLVDLQVVSSDSYAAAGVAQRLRTEVLAAERGSIFDRNGHELAMSVSQRTVWADPRAVEDAKATAAALAPLLGVDAGVLRAKLEGDGAFVYLARQIDLELAGKVDALDLPGVHLVDESKRFTPSDPLARSILGDVDIDSRGISGLEAMFDASLVGVPGELQIEKGPDGRTIAGGRQQFTPAQRGNDLVLTIDQALQYEVERALAEQIVAKNARNAMAVVMDPTSGEILAMATVGRDEEGNPRVLGENRALTVSFEPGSTNKVITIAGALEEGLQTPESTINVPDRHRVSVHTFTDHDPHPTENWSTTRILAESSNVGTIKIAEQLGVARMQRYLEAFGLGRPSGLDFPQENRGVMKTGRWDGTDIGSIPIGYGVSLNAVQLLQVYNTLANGGEWIQPHLVREIVGPDGDVTRPEAPERRRVVSERTAKQMTAMLAEVVKAGTGGNAAIDGYSVAGKTGTARKVGADGKYQTGAYYSSFAGFVPAENPRLSAIVVMDEPRPVYYASQVAAPVFARVQQYALRQFRIPPPSQDLGVSVPEVGTVDPNRRD